MRDICIAFISGRITRQGSKENQRANITSISLELVVFFGSQIVEYVVGNVVKSLGPFR